jgi:hypothetical protein
LKPNQYAILDGKRLVNGLRLHVVGAMLPDGKLLVLVTDKNPDQALKEISVFRYGLDYIRQILLNFHESQDEFHAIVRETLEGRFTRNYKMELSR